ncbi:ABC transporter ATP-binding protein [Paenalkalicoccus suaedae]|uniref:ABC transporter ATP-binding protein n=1 Tax=Paenalkalicoccus suaedae TaxID=2592382 RepID=A0A859FIF2_9BACI|nr:ABC transporter ATP-binding protein [Paenalkalicoccus suaedae]QKS72452.1 ABC transporter ATP-binding protein [Paenalkalicoccus suaedae]
MELIHIDQLTKKFGTFTALQDVSFTLNKGEVLGFIGPNGAGKSTTIRSILGMTKPTSGTISIFGQDAFKDAVSIHKRLAYVPGDVHLWPNLTGGEVIDLFIKLSGTTSYDKEKRDTLIERFNFDPTKKCRTYSKGNRQKVALIAAFSTNADVYILDEPTSGLDPLMENVFQDCVREVKAEGKSVLLSSHILSEVEKLCDRVAIIREGQIIEVGSLTDMRHLTRTHMLVQTEKPLHLEEHHFIHDVVQTEEGTSFQVDTDHLDDVIKLLSAYGVKKLESAPPTLETLFMRHYETSDEA